jgi:hypothetical protein
VEHRACVKVSIMVVVAVASIATGWRGEVTEGDPEKAMIMMMRPRVHLPRFRILIPK